MKTLCMIGAGLLLVSCASSHPANNHRVVTVSEAMEADPQEGLRTGVYKKNSTNEALWLQVTNLRQQVEELQRDQFEKKKMLQHLQKTNEEQAAKNDRTRIRLNTGVEDTVESDETPTTSAEKTPPKIVGFKDNAVLPTQVEYKDQFRLSNEGSVQPGVGTKPLYPAREPASELPAPIANSQEVQ